MNRTLIIASVMVLTACVNDSPLYIGGFFSLPAADCSEVEFGKTQQGGGSLDLASGASYQIGLKLFSEMTAELDTTADDRILVRGIHRNTINLDQINLKYTVVPSSIALENESEALLFVIPPATENPIRLGSLFGEKAIEKLGTSLPNAGDRADVRVQMTFSGNIISGGKVVSTPVSFPVTVFRGGGLPVCPAGQVVAQNGPCGARGGQDGIPVCCALATEPTKCVP